MSILISGKNYKWKGKNIRVIGIDGFNCATMPKQDSSIFFPIYMNSKTKYKIYLVAKNSGGAGKLCIRSSGSEIDIEEQKINILSSLFSQYSVEIKNNEDANGWVNLRLFKVGKYTGNVIIKEIKYEEVVEKNNNVEKKIKTNNTENEFLTKRKEELQNILLTRGNNMAIVGGNSYRWKGKGIKSVHKNGTTIVELSDKKSIIMIPVSVTSEASYRISLVASKLNGNGTILVNFFGSKNFDGIPASIDISYDEMIDYNFVIKVPRLPSNLPVYLRLWRPDNSTGKIYIKTIQYNKIEQPKEKNNTSVIKEKIENIKNKKENNKTIRVAKIVDDRNIMSMQFRPYELRKNSSENITKVMVNSPEKVPKVSIITPTRDGLDLLRKCYIALNENTSYANWEWIIGDSASTDGTPEYIKSLNDARIKYIERGTTDGSFSSINNELTSYASGEFFLFLNNDTEPQPFWLHEMMSKILHNPEIGIVGARLIYNEKKIQHAGICFIPQGPANICHSVLDSFPEKFAYHDRYYQAVTGACMLMRSEDFKAVGGFDPVYYFCYEDVDLCLKIRKQLNKKILYAANAILKHAESITQKKYKTSGEKQKEGIRVFKERWMKEVSIDFDAFRKNINKDIYKIDVSFVTCVNNMKQYINYVVNSLLKNNTKKNYEVIPIINFDNRYSAAKALNAGIVQARGDIVVLCHQDVIFYQGWIDMLFDRIREIELQNKKWGVLGTAGITLKDDTYGVVHNIKGSIEWQSTKRVRFGEVQTVDEHCMIIKKSNGLRFDSDTFNGWHMYGPDLCLLAASRGMKNYGILCPLVHDSSSGSLISGRNEFMRLLNALAKKWRSKFDFIRTPTSIIRKKMIRTFVKFK